MNKRILIDLGGNAIKQSNEKGTTEEQYKNCYMTTKYIAEIVRNLGEDDRLILTHGNGPQVGNLMVQQELGKNTVPPPPYGYARSNDSRANWFYVTTDIKRTPQ